MKAKPLTIDQISAVHALLEYDETSESCLRWKTAKTQGLGRKDRRAGSFDPRYGYWNVHIGGRFVKAQRIVWLLCGGIEPPSHLTLDHINRDRSDNRISNLRLATVSEQLKNRKKWTCKKGIKRPRRPII